VFPPCEVANRVPARRPVLSRVAGSMRSPKGDNCSLTQRLNENGEFMQKTPGHEFGVFRTTASAPSFGFEETTSAPFESSLRRFLLSHVIHDRCGQLSKCLIGFLLLRKCRIEELDGIPHAELLSPCA
jgi:hypothetical protein